MCDLWLSLFLTTVTCTYHMCQMLLISRLMLDNSSQHHLRHSCRVHLETARRNGCPGLGDQATMVPRNEKLRWLSHWGLPPEPDCMSTAAFPRSQKLVTPLARRSLCPMQITCLLGLGMILHGQSSLAQIWAVA